MESSSPLSASHRPHVGGEVLAGEDDDADPASPRPAVDAIDVYALDRVLSRLEGLDPQQGRVVELRFFGGLTIEETVVVMGLSSATVKREWAVARAWLYRELTDNDSSATPGKVD